MAFSEDNDNKWPWTSGERISVPDIPVKSAERIANTVYKIGCVVAAILMLVFGILVVHFLQVLLQTLK